MATFNYSDNATFEMIAGPVTPNHIHDWYSIALYVLGSLHLLFSIWMVTEYFLLNWRNFVLPSFIYTNKIVSGIRG